MLTVITDPRKVDFDEMKDIIKGVQVAIVCVMLLSNGSLMINRIARKGCRVFSQAHYAVQLSLCLAGMLSALFSNVVNTIIMFDMDDHGLNCQTVYLSNCYFFTFLPMVYTTGMIILAVDLVLRLKTEVYKSLGGSTIYAVVCAIVPWAVPFAVSCPLTLTDIEWDMKCANTQSTRHIQAAIICCTLVPVGLVLMTAFGVAVLLHPRRSYTIESFDSPMYTINSNNNNNNASNNYNGGYANTDDHNPMTNGTPETISKLNSSTGNASSPPMPIPIMSLGHNEDYPSFTHIQGVSLSKEKWKLLASMFLLSFNLLPYSCVFMLITTDYTSLSPVAFFYMVKFDPFLAYNITANLLNLYQIILPIVWLCTKY